MGISGGPYTVRDSSLILELDASDRNSYVSGSTTWKDVTPYGNNMSNINTPGYTSNYGGGIVYDGLTQYSNISGTENQITSSAVTLEIICSVTSNTSTATGGNVYGLRIIAFRQNTRTNGYEGYILSYNTGSNNTIGTISAVAASTTGTQVAASVSSSTFNVPMVIAASFDSSYVKIYLNGQFVTQSVTGFALNYNTGHKLTLGRANANGQPFDGYFNGTIYSYKQYNRVLTVEEIQQNYNQLKSRFNL